MPLYLNGVEQVGGGSPDYYSSTMSGHETFTYGSGNELRCFLDPDGSVRNFNPSGSFPTGYSVVLVNMGAHDITFDSATLAAVVGSAKLGIFYWDGTLWH